MRRTAGESETRNASAPLLFYADGYKFPDVYHLTRFLSPDAIIALEDGSEVIVVANSLEEGRVRKQSRATSVFNIDAFGAKDFSGKGMSREELDANVIARFLASRDTTRVNVAWYFPVGMAERLRGLGIAVDVVHNIGARRRAKRPDEIEALDAAQRATEDAWAKGVGALRRTTAGADKVLQLDGAPFTAERLRAIVEGRLLDLGYASDGAIIAPGPQAADPHMSGSGPLHAGEPIVMDIFPQHKTSRYWADMTRTVSKGEPSAAILKMYEVVKRAQDAGIKALRPGITGREVHELVEDIIFAAGYDTLRPGHQHAPSENGALPKGFIHGTGHGVGLEIHEAPSVGRGGTDPLAPGDVVTVEPGVYDPEIGGVRLEDMLLITETGSRNFTRAPRQLIV